MLVENKQTSFFERLRLTALFEVFSLYEQKQLMAMMSLATFTTGGAGLVIQYLLAAMTSNLLGNSHVQYAMVGGIMMLFMGIGSFAQRLILDKNLVKNFVYIEIALALIGGFAPLVTYFAFGFTGEHFIFIFYFFVCSIAFLIGFEIPIIVRILEQADSKIANNLGTVYAADYIGAFIFMLFWVFFLLPYLPFSESSFIVSGMNFLVAVITIIFFVKKGYMVLNKLMIFVLVFTTISLSWGYSQNRDWSELMLQRFFKDPICATKQSVYQKLVLTCNPQTGDVRLYINGNTQFSSIDEGKYHDFLVHMPMSMSSNIKNVLILGGGDGLALREVRKYPSVEKVLLVDLDPEMGIFSSTNKEMLRLNKGSFSDARVLTQKAGGITGLGTKPIYFQERQISISGEKKIHHVADIDVIHIDADQFLSQIYNNGKKWDAIIIDFPDPSIPALTKLYSKEFFFKLQWIMHEETVVSIQSTSPINAKDAYLTIGRTMEASGLKTIPYHANINSFGEWGYYLAWKGGTSVKERVSQIHNVEEFLVETEFLTPETLVASLAFGKGELETKDTCVNTMMFPCLLDQYTKGWKHN